MKLTFLGAAGTVTGSKYLVETSVARILVDCGLFQGLKRRRDRNWRQLPVDASSIDAVVLTHAHLDHSGYLPVLIKRRFTGAVYCTGGTRALCGILLPDSGYLQEDDARYAKTMTETVGHLRRAGLAPPVGVGVHAVFSGDAYRHLQSAGIGQVVTTDTIHHETNAISVGEALAQNVRELLE